ncbi:MAG: RagB/SusD family nutrient uptake outer membrane protein [Bacteroidales bacterium]|nr:RagB/SusD family nutrient uptake outer membrane protein [Bacteroidales bacterium]
MKRIINILFCTAATAVLVSCNGFLDRSPYNENSSASMFSSALLAESVVSGAYSNIIYDYVSSGVLNFDAFSSVMDPNYTDIDLNYPFLRGTVLSGHGMFTTYWKRFYEGINRANDVINNIGRVPDMEDGLKAQRIAECRFLRAFHYYRLNCLWRGVPYYDKNLAPDEYTEPRKSEEEIWDLIIGDLDKCIECETLPTKYASGSPDYGRVTKGAAYALRGKVHLWKKEWKLAEEDFRAVMDCGYSLYTAGSYADLFTLPNEHCDEMIFSAQMVEQDGHGNAFSRTYGNYCTTGYAYCSLVLNTQFVESFEEVDGKPFDWDNYIPGYNSLDPKARSAFFLRNNLTDAEKASLSEYGADLSLYDPAGNEARISAAYAKRDPRLAAIAITPYSVYSGGASGVAVNYTYRFPYRDWATPYLDLNNWTTAYMFYPIRKFVSVGRDCLNVTYNPLDIPIIRFADVLLCLAEAVNEQGNWQEAVTLVNMVRSRAGVALLNAPGNTWLSVSDADSVRDRIRMEKRWELACEGQLYAEELRWGTWKDTKFADGNGLLQVWGAPLYNYIWGGNAYYKWAIPRSEKEKNTNLTQNDFWD